MSTMTTTASTTAASGTTDAGTTLALWVAYGTNGVVGSIRHVGDEYRVTMAGADAATGAYPSLASAKGALHSHMAPGSAWPMFQQH